MTALIIDEGGPGERRIPLDGGLVTLGREEDNDVLFEETETLVSGCHASLQPETTMWYVRDEGSRYGTFLNDRRVKEHGLQDGDLIELGVGGPRIRFVTGGEEPTDPEEDDEGTEVRRAYRTEEGGDG